MQNPLCQWLIQGLASVWAWSLHSALVTPLVTAGSCHRVSTAGGVTRGFEASSLKLVPGCCLAWHLFLTGALPLPSLTLHDLS